MRSEKTPSDRAIGAFGSGAAVGEVLGVGRGAVSQWKARNNGRIPSEYQRPLLKAAAERHLKLSAHDVIEQESDLITTG